VFDGDGSRHRRHATLVFRERMWVELMLVFAAMVEEHTEPGDPLRRLCGASWMGFKGRAGGLAEEVAMLSDEEVAGVTDRPGSFRVLES